MVSLRRLRTERGWTLARMCAEIGVSIATLSRIEAKERIQGKLPLDEKVVRVLTKKVNEVFSLSCLIDDLPVTIAPPRTGRPKKAKSEVAP